MKGIILAGGIGSRLYPLTLVASKQLQPVYDKPMIYYPLSTLIENGVREFLLIGTPQDVPRFRQLLGTGEQWGLAIDYQEQPRPEGIAQAFLIGESFIGGDSVALILGDNIFQGGASLSRAFSHFSQGATIFGCQVPDPHRYGVVELNALGKAVSIEEKPGSPKSAYAITGLYLYDSSVVSTAKSLRPSERGELEITDVNRRYLERGQLHVTRLSKNYLWLDAGTPQSLYEAATKVRSIERRRGVKLGSPEVAAFRRGFVSPAQFRALVAEMPACEYRDDLSRVEI